MKKKIGTRSNQVRSIFISPASSVLFLTLLCQNCQYFNRTDFTQRKNEKVTFGFIATQIEPQGPVTSVKIVPIKYQIQSNYGHTSVAELNQIDH